MGGLSLNEANDQVITFERFELGIGLRVLLVESDYSTRQIISALLGKCSYRVVAVADGLKAWTVLKRSPKKIDIVLTEMELPSISGFALLTLIMEHDVSKNIPVIVMSSNDSISIVYKCMLKGAIDFLVKPIRKNELRNLWQHVWRRQSQSFSVINGLKDEQQKVEATAENILNYESNHSSDYSECVEKNKECIEKGNDAQSSCTVPYMEAESAYKENVLDLSQSKLNISLASDLEFRKHEECFMSGHDLLTQEIESDACRIKDLESDILLGNSNNTDDAFESNEGHLNSSEKAIDLIGVFNNYTDASSRSSNLDRVKAALDSFPDLGLTLKPHTLIRSDASAFSWYINRPMWPLRATPVNLHCQQKDGANSDNHVPAYTCGSTLNGQASLPSVAIGQFGSPIFYTQSGPPLIHSPNTDRFIIMNQHQTTAESFSSKQVFAPIVKGFNNLIPADQSSNSADGGNEEGLVTNSARVAALAKFRLKRKDRCFEKKVRYESRKKLAEKRPRVKGQFVSRTVLPFAQTN